MYSIIAWSFLVAATVLAVRWRQRRRALLAALCAELAFLGEFGARIVERQIDAVLIAAGVLAWVWTSSFVLILAATEEAAQ